MNAEIHIARHINEYTHTLLCAAYFSHCVPNATFTIPTLANALPDVEWTESTRSRRLRLWLASAAVAVMMYLVVVHGTVSEHLV